MKFSLILFLCFAICILGACTSKKLIDRADKSILTENTAEKLNGVYNNKPLDEKAGFSFTLWENMVDLRKKWVAPGENASVKIELLPEKKIKFSLMYGGVVTREKILRYKIKDGNVFCYNNRQLQGMPLIFWRRQKIDLAFNLNSAGNLLFESDGVAGGGVFIMYFGGPIEYKGIFARL